MKNAFSRVAIGSLALATVATSVEAMPLQFRDTEPAVGARQSNTYHGPNTSGRGRNPAATESGIASDSAAAPVPTNVPAWKVDQEVMQVREGTTVFTLRMENIAQYDSMVFSDGSSQAAGMSHGVYAVHPEGWPVYEPGEETLSASGLEHLAEDGNVRPMQAYLETHPDVLESGIFYKPVGWETDGELWPGDVYEVKFSADPGDKLSIATMLMQSNDLIYGPIDGRLDLFDDSGRPISGDITARFELYDAGTEANEDPKFGPNVGLNQKSLDTGPSESEPVRLVDDGFDYPSAPEVLRITIQPTG